MWSFYFYSQEHWKAATKFPGLPPTSPRRVLGRGSDSPNTLRREPAKKQSSFLFLSKPVVNTFQTAWFLSVLKFEFKIATIYTSLFVIGSPALAK